jgi:protein phosphatase
MSDDMMGPDMRQAVTVDAFGLTDVGRVRRVNEDQFLLASMHKVMQIERTSLPASTRERLDSGAVARLLLVADGVGGHAAGDAASGLALETVAAYVTHTMRCFYQIDMSHEQDLLRELESLVRKSHETVQSAAEAAPDQRGMATTLTVAHLIWPNLYVVQVGDSRCYRLRGNTLEQLTKDQTMAQSMVDQGLLSQEKADGSKWSHVLSSAVGMEVHPVTSKATLAPGDTLLLCTDGLTKHVSDGDVAARLEAANSAEAACRSLVSAALDAGGSDNVTVVCSRFR